MVIYRFIWYNKTKQIVNQHKRRINIKTILLSWVLIMSMYTDHKERKIKNSLLLPPLIIAWLYHLIVGGVNAFFLSVFACFLPMLILMPLFIFRLLPAGDIKMVGTIGGIMGLSFTFNSFVYAIFSAGVVAVFLLIKRRLIKSRFTTLKNYVMCTLLTRKITPYMDYNHTRENYMLPLSFFIALGCVIHMIFGEVGVILV